MTTHSPTAQHPISSGFDADSTAADVLEGIDLSGRLAIVTGGYSGVGIATVRALSAAGATVVVPARRPGEAAENLVGVDRVEIAACDLADLESVATFAAGFLATNRSIDILINCAGIMAAPETRVGPGWELQFATNHLGHFALTNRLWPTLAAGDGARVAAFSSRGHKFSGIRWDDLDFNDGYDKWQAYGQSKTANALFALHLRREEVAFLAGVSSHYYARLEQGAARNPSPAVLDSLGRVLGLDTEASAHLNRLAQSAPRKRSRTRARRPERVRPGLVRVIRCWTDQPAVIIGRHRDVLAANDLAVALNEQFTPGRNLLRDVFLDPAAREIYPDWQDVALGALAGVRASAGTELDDPHLTDLIGELSLKSPEFRTMWAQHDVRARATGTKRYNNPLVGEITLHYEALAVTGANGQTLMIFTAEPGSTDEQSLRMLASLAVPAM